MTGILIHHAAGVGVQGQPDIPMRESIPNLPYIRLTSLPDSPDDKGDRYHPERCAPVRSEPQGWRRAVGLRSLTTM